MSLYINGVEQVVAHEASHVAGGVDDIDSALAIAGMANLANTKVWQGNVGNRPVEVAMPAGYVPPTRSFFMFPHDFDGPAGPEARGDFSTINLNAAGEWLLWSFAVPADFASLTSVKIIYIGKQSNGETFDWTVTTDFGALGEAYTSHSDSVTVDGETPIADQIQSLDITAAFTGLAAADFCGVKLLIDAIAATPDAYVIGLEFQYSE